MKRFRPRRPRHATVVAYLALFVALGGTGYAAMKLPKNSVGSKQIKSNAVRSGKVKNRSLLAKDFKAGQLPKGPKGAQGDRGLPGTPATRLWVAVNAAGTIVRRSSPAITMDADSDPKFGEYIVDFGRDVSACVATATIADQSTSESMNGRIQVFRRSANKIYVDTETSSGADVDGARPFALVVFC